jgi:hypothetical protein
MTSEELSAAGASSTGEEIREFRNFQPREDNPVLDIAPDSWNREDGEIRSEDISGTEEDFAGVNADPRELIAAKSSKSCPLSFVFGESKFTANLIREYEAAGFFPADDGCAPLDEQTPTPKANEVVVFHDFFTCGLRFPCDPILPAILDKFSMKIHQLSLNSFLELSKFFWIIKTFRCNLGADIFARLFELVIEKDIIKLDDGQYYEAHYTCCTFNTRRQNS